MSVLFEDVGDGMKSLRVVVDTPLGIEAVNIETKGNGVLLVLENLQAKCAEALKWNPHEVEIVTVSDRETGDLLWPRKSRS